MPNHTLIRRRFRSDKLVLSYFTQNIKQAGGGICAISMPNIIRVWHNFAKLL